MTSQCHGMARDVRDALAGIDCVSQIAGSDWFDDDATWFGARPVGRLTYKDCVPLDR